MVTKGLTSSDFSADNMLMYSTALLVCEDKTIVDLQIRRMSVRHCMKPIAASE